MTSIADLLMSADTRPRALEALLIAQVLLRPELLDGRTRPKVSRAARFVLDAVTDDVAYARAFGPFNLVMRDMRFARAVGCRQGEPSNHEQPEPPWFHELHAKRVSPWDVARLAAQVERLSLLDLCELPTETVLAWLRSVERRPKGEAYMPPPVTNVAPWKRRRKSA